MPRIVAAAFVDWSQQHGRSHDQDCHLSTLLTSLLRPLPHASLSAPAHAPTPVPCTPSGGLPHQLHHYCTPTSAPLLPAAVTCCSTCCTLESPQLPALRAACCLTIPAAYSTTSPSCHTQDAYQHVHGTMLLVTCPYPTNFARVQRQSPTLLMPPSQAWRHRCWHPWRRRRCNVVAAGGAGAVPSLVAASHA